MPKEPTPSGIPDDRLAAYERLVATVPGLDRKGATMPYTSINGNMFSFLDASGALALRLSAADRTAFIGRFDAALHEAHGHVMKEYVGLPAAILAETKVLAPWFAASHAYAAGLKPKATTRR